MSDTSFHASIPSQAAEAADPRLCYALGVLLDREVTPDTWPRWFAYRPADQLREEHRLCVTPSGFFGPAYGSPRSLPLLPLGALDGSPVLYGAPRCRWQEGRLIVDADLLASAYFVLTRYEEWVRPEARDEHGRFSARESLPYRAGFLHRPVVDEYSALMRSWASRLEIAWAAPQRRFSVLLTHDVDDFGPPLRPVLAMKYAVRGLTGLLPTRTAIHHALVNLRWRQSHSATLARVLHADRRLTDRVPADLCQRIYFFIAGGQGKHDGAYRLDQPLAQQAIRNVLANGAEIGLHASYQAGECPELVRSERLALEQAAGRAIWRNRHHYLRWREPAHGQALAAAGITWDSTLCYSEVAGFRLGVCHPIPLFDPRRRCLLGIEEHPLTIMDGSLSDGTHMGLPEESALLYACQLADTVARHRGELVLLWHHWVLSPMTFEYHWRLYPKLLDYLASMLSGGESSRQPFSATR